jgi:hypothetical protein
MIEIGRKTRRGHKEKRSENKRKKMHLRTSWRTKERNDSVSEEKKEERTRSLDDAKSVGPRTEEELSTAFWRQVIMHLS